MSRIQKYTFSTLLAFIFGLVISFSALAAAGGGSTVAVGYAGQSVDSITFEDVTVDAQYAPGGGYGSSEYSCAALVMKFYKAVYGFDVWNLSSSGSTPICSNGESFSRTDTPRVGDIVRFQDRTHWALVKEVEGSTVTLIEQNWGYYSGGGYVAAVDRTVEVGDGQVSFFTYSAYGETAANIAEAEAQAQAAEDITWEQARENAFPDEEKISIESEDNLKLVALNKEIENVLNHSFM